MIIGLGIDIVENDRISVKIAKRLLTDAEYSEFLNKNINLQVEYLASRFAAKEAIVKATNKKYSINKIEILNDNNGRPYCTNIDNITLSISHEKNYSVAVAILEQ